MIIEPGRVCLKIAGRDAGKRCVVLSVKGPFAEVLSARKKRRVSIHHLEPMDLMIDIKGSEESVLKQMNVGKKSLTPEKKADKKSIVEKVKSAFPKKKEEKK